MEAPLGEFRNEGYIFLEGVRVFCERLALEGHRGECGGSRCSLLVIETLVEVLDHLGILLQELLAFSYLRF